MSGAPPEIPHGTLTEGDDTHPTEDGFSIALIGLLDQEQSPGTPSSQAATLLAALRSAREEAAPTLPQLPAESGEEPELEPRAPAAPATPPPTSNDPEPLPSAPTLVPLAGTALDPPQPAAEPANDALAMPTETAVRPDVAANTAASPQVAANTAAPSDDGPGAETGRPGDPPATSERTPPPRTAPAHAGIDRTDAGPRELGSASPPAARSTDTDAPQAPVNTPESSDLASRAQSATTDAQATRLLATPDRPAILTQPAAPQLALPVQPPRGETITQAPPSSSTAPVPVEGIPLQLEWLAQRGGGRARIQLYPPHLGRVDLEVRIRGGAVEVVLAVQEVAAQASLHGLRDPLADALASRDLRLGSFEVGSQADGGQREGSRQSGDSLDDRLTAEPWAADRATHRAAEAQTRIRTAQSTDVGVDVRI